MNPIEDPHTFPYPPLPKGYVRWERRPQGWKSEGPVTYAFFHPDLPEPKKWQVMPGTMQTFGDPKCHCIQAMMLDRCQTCDGTGDVHRPDGEYLGQCHCKTEPPAAAPQASTAERPTPLTDEDAGAAGEFCGDSEVVSASLARTLERQLAEAKEALERIRDGHDAPDIDATGEWQFGLHCGVEDRNCQDRYEGADYGHTVGVEKTLEWAANEATTALERITPTPPKTTDDCNPTGGA